VAVGSCAEYDWAFGRCSEFSTPLNSATTYGVCKNRLRFELEELGKETGLSAAWGRLFFLYGPHERPERFVPSVINSMLRGETATCSSGEKLRDYIFVKDAADALASLLDSLVAGPVNIGSGTPSAIRQIAGQIGEKLGRSDLLRFSDVQSDEPAEVSADTTRLNNEVGWSPQYNFDRGLEETINWWKLNGAAVSSAI
jgi:nucleoside-diphosphate-sugar epimerase